jgi:autotransporter-associated beta strand protein
MYMRETLNITGGTLTINYDPNYNNDFDNNPATNFPSALRSGPISAQFSGAVTLSGTGSLSVNTLRVDATHAFTLAGSSGTLTFKQIILGSHTSNPAKLLLTGDANISPLANGTATISNSGGGIASGQVDLGGGTRGINLSNGTSDVDLDIAVPITNGGITKSGAGTLRLSGNNTFSGPVTVNGGVLRYNHASGLAAASVVTVNNTGTLDMNNIADTIAALASDAGNSTGVVLQGTAGLTLAAASGDYAYGGNITGTGTLAKTGAAKQILAGNNSLGPVSVTAGSLLFNGTSNTGAVTVGAGATLGGTGSLSGAVTINSGGHLAPGASIESLDVGSLFILGGSQLDFELGAGGAADRVNVAGVLNLGGGTLNVANSGGATIGTYTLFDYGSLVGNVSSLGAPTGLSQFKLRLEDTGSEINLIVSMFGDFNSDGLVDSADYNVWRKGLGTTYTEADYEEWRAHYGDTAAGLSAAAGSAGAIPEPAAVFMLLTGLLPFCGRRCRV